MDFPSLGDANQYMEMGTACAHYISGANAVGNPCYHDYRPIGIVLYYALPFIFTDDPVSASYVTLFMNLLFLLLLLYSGLVLIRKFTNSNSLRTASCSGSLRPHEVVFVLLTLLLSVGFLPVRLSDHQSLAFFLTSVAVLSVNGDVPKNSRALLAGILAGCAVLFKQNYAIAITFLLISWLLILGRRNFRATIVPVSWFALGASSGLLQIVWVYWHSGIPWLYNPRAMAVFAPTNRQPMVEMVAYTAPILSAYFSQLRHHVPGFEYFTIKFFIGLTKFYWAVYLGKAPFDKTPEFLDYTKLERLGFDIVFLISALFAFASLATKEKWLAVLVITAFFSVSLNSVLGHVESRYFYFLRLSFLIYSVVIVAKYRSWCSQRRAALASAERK